MLCQWQVGAIALDALLLGLQGWKLMACRVIRCPKGHRFLFPFGFHKNFRFFSFIHFPFGSLFLYICEIHRGTTQPTSATLNFLLRTGRVHRVPSMVKGKKPTELRAPTSAASVSKVHPNPNLCNIGWKWCLLNLTSTDSGVCVCVWLLLLFPCSKETKLHLSSLEQLACQWHGTHLQS